MFVDLEKLKEIVREAGEIISQANLTPEQIRSKTSQKDLVTKYDVEVQDFLESRFQELWPDRHFMGEEQVEYRYEQRGFLVDPIDGTSNFIFGIPHFCISVAVLEQGEIVQGVVYNPVVDEMYWAEVGQGSYLNGDRLKNPEFALGEAVFGVGGSPYDPNSIEPTVRLIAKIMEEGDIRRLGSAALDLCYVASGRQGGYFEFAINPWDIAAGLLIAREAGVTVTTLDGEEPPLTRTTSILAAGPKIYAKIKNFIGF